MNFFLQVFVSGLMVGGVYSLAAVGFVIVYSTTKVLNFAYGEFVMIGAFLIYLCVSQLGLPWGMAIPIVIILMVAISFLIEKLILRPLVGRSTTINTMMVTIGLSMILLGIARIIWGSEQLIMPSMVSLAPVTIGIVKISKIYLLSLSILAFILIALGIFFKKSVMGIAMRAISNDEMGAYTVGINIPLMLVLSWSIAGVIAGVSGVILANLGLLTVDINKILITLFPVIILGGLESVKGAVISGFIIGVIEAMSQVYLDPLFGGLPISQIATIITLLLLILIYPYGFFGVRTIERL